MDELILLILSTFFQLKSQPTYYLFPSMKNPHSHTDLVNIVSSRSEYFENSFIPCVNNGCDRSDLDFRSSTSSNEFLDPLSVNPTKWSNTLSSSAVALVCLAIL